MLYAIKIILHNLHDTAVHAEVNALSIYVKRSIKSPQYNLLFAKTETEIANTDRQQKVQRSCPWSAKRNSFCIIDKQLIIGLEKMLKNQAKSSWLGQTFQNRVCSITALAWRKKLGLDSVADQDH